MRKKNLTKAVETTVAPNPKEVDIWVEPKDGDTVSLKYYDYHDKEWVGGSDGEGETLMEYMIRFQLEDLTDTAAFNSVGLLNPDTYELIPHGEQIDILEYLGDGQTIATIPATRKINENKYSVAELFIGAFPKSVSLVEVVLCNAKLINNHLEIFLKGTLHTELFDTIPCGTACFVGPMPPTGNYKQELSNNWCVCIIASKRITEDNMLTVDFIREAIKQGNILDMFAFEVNAPIPV